MKATSPFEMVPANPTPPKAKSRIDASVFTGSVACVAAARKTVTKVLPGFYVEANTQVRLTRHVALFAAGRYDWAGTLHGSVGPSDFALDLGGWTVQGGVTITF